MKTILLVDDSSTILLSMGDILTKAGFKVEKASNGKEALTKLQSGLKPNLVITDVNMPLMNGIELVREAKKLPGMRFTPMLVLTTESQQSMRDEGKKAGATGWLVKPVNSAQLLQVVKQVVPGA
ncbi:response regulator [Ectothiorhodospiraceae bacterium BW-2]|nr:response regulator [Ectothiorhodospiraceae bacterium BW-2]